jgi:beta-xylosidase
MPLTRSLSLSLSISLSLTVFAACGFDAAGSGESEQTASALPTSTFTNPVIARDCPDPGVLRIDGEDGFVMACTGGRFGIRSSPDLVTWSDTTKSIFPDGKPPWAKDGKRDWAPEIHALGPNAYVASYTASDANGRLAIGAAHAADPVGPWTDRGQPLVQHAIGVIDATFFADDDGKKYLYWKVDGNQQRGVATPILVRELTADGMGFAAGSSAVEVLTNDPSSWEGPIVEAPYVVKRDGTYFMFYAGNVYDERYRTGVARSTSPTARFTKKGTPILGNNGKWLGPGHGTVVRTGGTDWFVHHAWVADAQGHRDGTKGRQVLLDAIVWKDGWPSFAGGSSAIGPQPSPSL